MSAKGKYQKWLEPENLILIQGWRRDGLSDKQIAENMGIAYGTLYAWLNRYDELKEAYKKGTEVSTYEVENALYKSALGYYVEEIEQVETEYPDGTKVVQKRKRRRHVPPSTSAQIFILKNRRSGYWSNNPVVIDAEEVADDGFIKALEGSAATDWEGEIEDAQADS